MINLFHHEFGSSRSSDPNPILPHNIRTIGLMADSHGNIDLLEDCIQRLKKYDVNMIIHLGDFFDSQHSHNAIKIIETIQKHQIYTVKGNNDYQVENALRNGCLTHIPGHQQKIIQAFLAAVPLRIVLQHVCFAHSLPYDSIRSFYEPIDTGNADRAERIFNDTDYRVIFSGHSHFPVLFRNSFGKVSRESLNSKTPVLIQPDERFIIIVGSVSEGESGIMDFAQMKYERIRA